jgi:potassium channel subfamily K
MDEEETNSPAPATWGYASTVFPLLAGTFGPMANAFSICALVENWTVEESNAEHDLDTQDSRR